MGRAGVLCCAAVLLFAFASSPARAGSPPQHTTLPSLAAVVERVMPAVVNVSVSMRAGASSEFMGPGDALDRELRRFFERNGLPDGTRGATPWSPKMTALGSGFIIDPAGDIVTNNHLVADGERVTVVLADKSRHQARIVGRDEVTDIALLKIDMPAPLPYVEWGDSDMAKVGDWVVAVGNPFGLESTVTAGIISASGRDIESGPFDNFLQIDAPINRGNSGGPTFNLDGEVVGINTAIYSPSGGSVGIGFAIPASFARQVVAQLKAKGHVDHGWLGVSLQNMTPDLARSFDIDPANPTGALVDEVAHGSPAARAGLRQGDVILAVNGAAVRVAHDLPRLIGEDPVGARVALTLRRDGKDQKLDAVVGAMPEPPHIADAAEEESSGSSQPPSGDLGMELQPLTPELRKRLQLPKSVDGVFVADLTPESPAASFGVKPGDVIVSIDRQKITSPQDLAERLRRAIAGGQVLMLVNRHGSAQFVGAALDDDRHASAAP